MFHPIAVILLLVSSSTETLEYNETIGFTLITSSEHFQVLEENYRGADGETELANEGGMTHCIYNVASKVRENYETYEVELFYTYDNATRLILDEGAPCEIITFFEGTSELKAVRKLTISKAEDWMIYQDNIVALPPEANIIQLASATALKLKRALKKQKLILR